MEYPCRCVMKNPNLKEKYINNLEVGENIREACKAFFKAAGDYEDQLGKDFAEMDKDEILAYLTVFQNKTELPPVLRLTFLRGYGLFFQAETGKANPFLETLSLQMLRAISKKILFEAGL